MAYNEKGGQNMKLILDYDTKTIYLDGATPFKIFCKKIKELGLEDWNVCTLYAYPYNTFYPPYATYPANPVIYTVSDAATITKTN